MAEWVKACGLEDLRRRRVIPLSHGGRVAAVFEEAGAVYAVDNRCPHMGFPLSKGTLRNGILTCHWHSWQFDASSGGCFTAGGSAAPVFKVEVRGEDVWVEFPLPTRDEVLAKWRAELNQGIERFSTLQLAKAAYTLLSHGGAARELVARGAALGVRYREDFSEGLSVLTAMATLVRDVALPVEAQTLALVHGLRLVGRDIERTPHRRVAGGLPGTRATHLKRVEWFRAFVHDREEEAAERVLVSVILDGTPPASVEAMLQAAIADSVFLDEGHVLDFANKAFELLGHLGWDHAPAVLPTLIPPLCRGKRHEEDLMWKQPHDLVAAGREAARAMERSSRAEYEREAFVATVLGDDPEAIGRAFAAAGGVPLGELASAVAEAAALRLGRFHTRNEFADWDWAHHAATTAEAARRMALRAPTPHLAQAVIDGAMYVFLARFLNIPKHALPGDRPAEPGREGAEALLDRLREAMALRRTEEVAGPIHAYLAGGHDEGALLRTFAQAALREDLGFHGFQALDYGIGLYRALRGGARAYVPLAAAARYIAAHSPTPRFVHQTTDNAIKLQRGEALHE